LSIKVRRSSDMGADLRFASLVVVEILRYGAMNRQNWLHLEDSITGKQLEKWGFFQRLL